MASLSMETNFISVVDDDHKHISHKISGVHILVNTLSKWVVALTLGGFIIFRHDALALWAATGSVSNYILSIALKRVLKQKRPVSDEGLGPGMPSSHAQTVFFTLVFVIVSVIERMGLSGATMALGILLVAIGSYFSWLRVLLGYHTSSQVFVGTIVGSNVAILWFWAWEAIVSKAYNSNPWVQILLMIGVVCYYLVFIFYILWHLIKD
ncbi:lipid phosphate phosphatase epsilon 2, chloroplastic [Helianthus annuus]|nr:lipid phosphate phosphatase epsilon 2, chloroplastic [Helianthus annuus]